jgi:hypothetical protein
MIQIPADLGQRILDAARIAAAMHEQQQQGASADRDTTVHAGGAGRAAAIVIDHDGRSNSKDGTPAPTRLRRWWSRVR